MKSPYDPHKDYESFLWQAPKRPVGRPKSITDMRAYKAMKAKEYRAKAKAIRLETIKANG